MKSAIEKAVSGQNLKKEEAENTIKEIMDGNATNSQIASFLTAMRMKGETVNEIAAFAKTIRNFSKKVEADKSIIKGPLVDTCGTGGDKIDTFNISTASAIVAAGAGVSVVKHGNRGVSSNCGSADVLEELGIPLSLSPGGYKRVLREVGMVFLYAPQFHHAIRHVMDSREQIGFRTFFNVIGPLSNPAKADRQLLGVFSANLTEKMAKVLKILGLERAMVVHGAGIDEITVCGETKITELDKGNIKKYTIGPKELGLKEHKLSDIKGGSTAKNAKILKRVLSGSTRNVEKAAREIVLANAGSAIYISGSVDSIKEGVEVAENTIDSGMAIRKLVELRRASTFNKRRG